MLILESVSLLTGSHHSRPGSRFGRSSLTSVFFAFSGNLLQAQAEFCSLCWHCRWLDQFIPAPCSPRLPFSFSRYSWKGFCTFLWNGLGCDYVECSGKHSRNTEHEEGL